MTTFKKWLPRVVCRDMLVRNFSVTVNLTAADPSNGLELDKNEDIINEHGESKEKFSKYFVDKKAAIIEQHRLDSNSGSADKVPLEELREWMEGKDELLKSLEDQKDDLVQLHEDLASDEETTEDSSRFPQDSSDVQDTSPSSWEPFDD